MFLHEWRGGRPVNLLTSATPAARRAAGNSTNARHHQDGKKTLRHHPPSSARRYKTSREAWPGDDKQGPGGTHENDNADPQQKYHQDHPPYQEYYSDTSSTNKGCSQLLRKSNGETARHNKGCGRDQSHANTKTRKIQPSHESKIKPNDKRQRTAEKDRGFLRALRSRIQQDSTFPFGP